VVLLACVQPGEIFASWRADLEALRTRNAPCLRCRQGGQDTMEFLNFLIILAAAWLVWRRPERETLAFRLVLASCVLMALLFLIGTHGSLVPGVNL